MAIIKCPECGRQISDKAPTCPSCGVEIAGKITKCPHCGEVYFSSQEMCPNCHEIAVGVTHPVASSAAVKEPTPVASPSPVSSPASEIPSTSHVVSSTSQENVCFKFIQTLFMLSCYSSRASVLESSFQYSYADVYCCKNQ